MLYFSSIFKKVKRFQWVRILIVVFKLFEHFGSNKQIIFVPYCDMISKLITKIVVNNVIEQLHQYLFVLLLMVPNIIKTINIALWVMIEL